MRAILPILILATTSARAEEATPEVESAEHHHHENHVAVFVGSTTGFGETDTTTSFTVGADYERRLSFITHQLGAGVLVDSAIGSEVETLIAGFVAYHPLPGLMVLGGAGAVMTGAGHNTAFALRGGAAYFFELGQFSLGPAFSVDHANGETAVVYGLSGGKGF